MIRKHTIAFAFAVMSYAAYGQTGEWTTAASACVPDEASFGMFQKTGARYLFSGVNVGTIEARCSVTNPADNTPNPGWSRMEVTLFDPDAMGAGAQVIAQLVEVNKFTGNVAVVATFNSNAFGAGILRDMPFAYAFNFVNFAYYIDLQVTRNAVAWVPWVARVRLHRD